MRKLRWVLLAGFGLCCVVFTVGYLRWHDEQKELREKERIRASIGTAGDPLATEAAMTDELLARSQRAETPKQRRQNMAWASWKRFDGQPDSFKTQGMLTAFLAQANQVAVNLPADEAAELQAYNLLEYRKRIAGLLVAGESGSAEGEQATTLVPPGDASRCAKLAEAWKDQLGADLKRIGFKEIRCGERRWPI